MKIFNSASNKLLSKIVDISKDWKFIYLLKPLIISALPVIMAFYSTDSIHKRISEISPEITSYCDANVLKVILYAAVLLFVLTAIFGWIEQQANKQCEIDDVSLHTLLKILDRIVGAKSARFGKNYKKLLASRDTCAKTVFNEITKPDEQIALLTEGIYSFFESLDKENVAIKVVVAPLKNNVIEDDWLYCAPTSNPPRTPLSELKHPESALSACLKNKSIVIIEDVQKEALKTKNRNFIITRDDAKTEEGSLVCYPVIHSTTNEVAYILSIYANKKCYFTKQRKPIFENFLQRFALRISLEHSLSLLKTITAETGVGQ